MTVERSLEGLPVEELVKVDGYEEAAYALYDVDPITAPPVEGYVVRVTAVVISRG